MIQPFMATLADSAQLRALYRHCREDLKLPGDYSDLLRMAVVYCMSALDKLVHDMIRHHMVETYAGRRPPTARYLQEPITMSNHDDLGAALVPPPELVFREIVRQKLAHLSFLDPTKLAEGLSLVWNEPHKWQAIASHLGKTQESIRTELSNLYRRRNAIVHETDRSAGTQDKLPMLETDAERAEAFVRDLGNALVALV